MPLLRPSLRVEVEDDGVRAGDWLEGSRFEGDAVPSLPSLFFLEDLLESLPRERTFRPNCFIFGRFKLALVPNNSDPLLYYFPSRAVLL